jgi:hypothetical protein
MIRSPPRPYQASSPDPPTWIRGTPYNGTKLRIFGCDSMARDMARQVGKAGFAAFPVSLLSPPAPASPENTVSWP